ncbi:MAG: right-handed parallel beta-helix repeat-containing protein, partial [Salinivirgaceae bacterium]|nr:right-handed parallel beta-helix repeat-containing protein [Salinivirgaceae bacterium]
MKSKYLKIPVLICLCMTLFFSNANAVNYYVSAGGSDYNNGTSSTSPFQTINKGLQMATAGSTVYIMNGTYNTTNGPILNIQKSGTSSNYITFKAYTGHTPKITASGNVWDAIVVDGSYIIIDGLELQGNNANITYAAAYQSWQNYENDIKDWAKIANFNTNCISLGKNSQVHHITIRNCKVHDFPGAGIGGGKIDYVTIENNRVYNNCWYMMYAGSGISILTPYNYDNSTGVKMKIRNNICYNNKTTIPWEKTNALSDGNGIILDVNTGFTGRTLVENNVSYNNGGGGVHAYKSDHVDIINNTAYNNGTVMGWDYPEMDANQCSDVRFYNNIMYARTGAQCNGNDSGTYNYNIYYNGTSYNRGANDIVADPKFVSKGLDGNANFRLLSTSPAINSGSTTWGQYSVTDILGITRPQGSASDRGAYEVATVSNRTPENPSNTVNGLEYKYYEGTWSALPNFGNLSPSKTGTVNNVDISPRTSEDNFAFRFT